MTIFDKIDVKLVQFSALSITILLSRKRFTWLMKLPIFVLFVCEWAITYPYFQARILAKTHHGITYSEWKNRLIAKVLYSETFEDLIKIFC